MRMRHISKFLPASFGGAAPPAPQPQAQELPSDMDVSQYLLHMIKDNAAYAPRHGIIHVGAHRCEEKPFYEQTLGINNIMWIDGNDDLCKERPEIINAIVADKDGDEVDFIITSNEAMSSSILELKDHLVEHPDCVETKRVRKKTVKLDTLLQQKARQYDMLVMDVQGAELLVLRGAHQTLSNIKCIVTEVNTKELYKDCAQIGDIDAFLEGYGFARVCTNMTRHGWGDALYVRKLVTIKICAGLGNRLFQLAFLYAISKKTNRLPVLYEDLIEGYDAKYDAFYAMFPRYRGSCTAGVHTIMEDIKKPCVYIDYVPAMRMSATPIIKFQGYFQSLEFFKDSAKDIRDSFLQALDNQKVPQSHNFIHVRGKDYLGTGLTTHCLPKMPEYYMQAIKDARITAKDTVVITDDEEYTKAMRVFEKYKIHAGKDDLEALRVMTRCKRVAITANSTFSWWGAFLGNAEQVYMPRPYLIGGLECRDIYFGQVKRVDVLPRKQVFEDLLVARRFGGLHLHMIFVRKNGQQGEWFCDHNILINNAPAYNVQFISKDRHNDIYHDMCIVKHRVAVDKVFVTLNGITQEVKVEEHELPATKKHKLVAMTMFKDDIDHIESYVRYYRKLGVEQFYLYYNDAKSIDMLPQFDDVTYYQWPYPYTVDGMHVAQWGAMSDMIQVAKHVADFVLFNDMDEYIIWRPKHVSMKDFVALNGFKVYAFLNNFVILKDPTRIGLQIEEGKYEKVYEMSFPNRSKCIVNPMTLDVMGVHKPMHDVSESEICVLAGPMCELLHICNLRGRNHVSLNQDTIEKMLQWRKKIS